jgi:hypothetical protein
MKTPKKLSVSKLLTRFDNELKNIIMNDLKALKEAQNKFLITITPDHLSAA